MSQPKELPPGKLRVEAITIGPEDGEHLTLDPSALWLWKGRAKPCAALRLTYGAPAFTLYDANGQERLTLLLAGDGTPAVHLQDGNGRARLTWYLTESGHVHMECLDGEENTRLRLSLDEDESDPAIALCDRQGKELLEIMLDHEGRPSLMLRNAEGHRVPWLTVPAEQEED